MGSTSSMCGAPAAAVPVSLEGAAQGVQVTAAGSVAAAAATGDGTRDAWPASGAAAPAAAPSPTSSASPSSAPRPSTGSDAGKSPAAKAAGKLGPQASSGGIAAKLSAGGLAARRGFVGGIAVASNKKPGPDMKDQQRRRKIQWCPRLTDLYEFGGEVMPSCHSGMQVLFGKQRTTGMEVVIKVRAKKQSFREDEEKEWRLSTEYMLNLPVSGNIATLHEVLEDVNCYYVVMEKCAGQDLFESIHNQSKLNIDETRDALFQILTALAEMHAEGLVHKDLKLENVMIDRTPSTGASAKQVWPEEQATSPVAVKIVDFDTVEEHTPKSPKKAKDVLGTDQYIAQEAYAGNYSPASDVFAVGVIAYRLLVGRFPFDPKMFNDKPGENWVGSPKMKEIREKLCKFQVNYDHRVFQREPEALALVKAMLNMKELERPSAKEALAHPWFAKARSPPGSPRSPKSPKDPFATTAIGGNHSLPNCVQERKSNPGSS